jgi:hypothetical protein
MRKILSVFLILITSSPLSAFAMGSGDPYVDAQTGLTYSLYKPVQTLTLPQTKFQLLPCGGGEEEWVYARFSKAKKKIEVMQTMKGIRCSDPGLSVKLPSVKINGVSATSFVYCDPTNSVSVKKCSSKDFPRFGGYLLFNLPGYYGMKATSVQVQASGGITYSQLLSVARSLTPASTKPSN